MGSPKTPNQLAGLLGYVLGRRPDEFGLVPDEKGYVKIKELLKALGEEPGWRHVRRSDIQEILLTLPDPPIEVSEGKIRSTDRTHLPLPLGTHDLPKLLYTCVRSRAYPHVMEKGIAPGGHPQVILTGCRNLAERIGRRIDPAPTLLTVHAETARQKGVVFHRAGESIYLAEQIPVGCFSGPPLPKESKRTEPQKIKPPSPPAGSFFMDVERIQNRPKLKGRKKEILWKKERKRIRKDEREPGW